MGPASSTVAPAPLTAAARRGSTAGRRPARHTLRVVTVTVEWLEPDLCFARCVDRRGRRYSIDRRTAISFSALREGQTLKVRAFASGVIAGLASTGAEAGGAAKARRQRPARPDAKLQAS